MNVVDFTQLVVLLAWLAQPAGMFAWMLAWTNWLRNVRLGDPDLLSPLEIGFREWLETGWRKSPLFIQLFHAVIAALVPAIAFGITSFVPPETLLRLQPYFAFLGMIYLSYVGSQAWYLLTKPKPAAAPTTVQNVYNQPSAEGGAPLTNETNLNVTTPQPVNAVGDQTVQIPEREQGKGQEPIGAGSISPGVEVEAKTSVELLNLGVYSYGELLRLASRIENEARNRETPPPGYQASGIGLADNLPKG